MPSKTYGEAIAIEIARLESVGESIVEHVYVVSDDIEIGIGNRIPLWLFGYLE